MGTPVVEGKHSRRPPQVWPVFNNLLCLQDISLIYILESPLVPYLKVNYALIILSYSPLQNRDHALPAALISILGILD